MQSFVFFWSAYQNNDITEFEKILKTNHSNIMDDPFIREHIEGIFSGYFNPFCFDYLVSFFFSYLVSFFFSPPWFIFLLGRMRVSCTYLWMIPLPFLNFLQAGHGQHASRHVE